MRVESLARQANDSIARSESRTNFQRSQNVRLCLSRVHPSEESTSPVSHETYVQGSDTASLPSLYAERDRKKRCLEEIVKFYNPESGATARRELFDAQSYSALLKIDERLVDFAETLPSYFRNVLPGAEADETLDDQHPHLRFYRALVAGTFRFYRTLLHRPFFLQMPAEGEAGRRRRRHPFPRSWNVCLHTALDELRSRRIGNDGLDELERVSSPLSDTNWGASIIASQ